MLSKTNAARESYITVSFLESCASQLQSFHNFFRENNFTKIFREIDFTEKSGVTDSMVCNEQVSIN